MRELLRRLDSYELTEWQCYFALEPWGEERADLRAGIVSSVTANTFRDSKTRPTPYTAQDFMPYYERTRAETQKKNSPKTEVAYLQLMMALREARARKNGSTEPPRLAGGI